MCFMMSQQSDPKKADAATDSWRSGSSRKRPRRRPFIIEWRYGGNHVWMKSRWGKWRKWGAYETKKQRDYALEQKQKSDVRIEFEYRGVDA